VMTRKWKNRSSIIKSIKLFLIDEIHVLGESNRGATIEAVVSRMKGFNNEPSNSAQSNLRFIAISATIPNIQDVVDI
jgi:replicative superfamily II helicase